MSREPRSRARYHEVLRRNRETKAVAFRISKQHTVDAWVEQRASTLDAGALKFCLRMLAREADRIELLLTARDCGDLVSG